jgi:hypothetical protein
MPPKSIKYAGPFKEGTDWTLHLHFEGHPISIRGFGIRSGNDEEDRDPADFSLTCEDEANG